MEKSKKMELEILVAIRNNPKTPADEFYIIFEGCWPQYRAVLSDLYNKGLLIISPHEMIPGLNRLELTVTGKRRETELLLERAEGLSRILIILKKTKKLRTAIQKTASLKLMQA
jgi:hypothetical protein